MARSSTRARTVVVDGSNIATEGRSEPSLEQLDQAITAFLEEYPEYSTSDVIVVVDATFEHRIDQQERPTFDAAVEHGEVVSPPAGTIGRGDAFILRIADKASAVVVSNDSFQEFHAEHPWLFDDGRLIGGKPIPGVGWVFAPRLPVRGPRSRAAVSAQRRRRPARAAVGSADAEHAADASPAPAAGEGASSSGNGSPSKVGSAKAGSAKVGSAKASAAKVAPATTTGATPSSAPAKGKAAAVKAAKKAAKATKAGPVKADGPGVAEGRLAPAKKAGTRGKKAAVAGAPTSPDPETTKGAAGTDGADGARRATSSAGALNEPLAFLTFVAEHPVGSTVTGTVVSFTSHGAHVDVGDMRCHVPLRGLGDPPPSRARDVIKRGEVHQFEVVGIDPNGRRAELALVS